MWMQPKGYGKFCQTKIFATEVKGRGRAVGMRVVVKDVNDQMFLEVVAESFEELLNAENFRRVDITA